MTAAQPTQYLSTTPLSIGYQQKGHEICIAKTPNLQVYPGDFICLLGPNGAGKSTLIRTLAGMQAPLQGTVKLNDRSFNHFNARERARRISVVLTEMPSPGMMDAYSLVALGRHPYSGRFGVLRQKDRKRIDWAFQAMDASGLKNCQVAQLSDGERQKLLIARALAQETPLMLLDEPTAFLDLPHQVELMVTLRKLAHQEPMGILFSTHNLDLALRFADRIWLFDESKTITKGYPEELAINGAISRTFSGKEVEWNAEQGAFRVQESRHLKASVKGDGISALWTRRALERLGFTIIDDAETTALQISVEKTGQKSVWSIYYNSQRNHFGSISSFINWASQQNSLNTER